MINTLSITNRRGGKHDSTPKKRGDLWEYQVVARIVSAVAIGYHSRKLLEETSIPKGNLNKYLKKITEEGFLYVSYDGKINRRNRESLEYHVNYHKLIDKLVNGYIEVVKEYREQISNAVDNIKKRISLIEKRYSAYNDERAKILGKSNKSKKFNREELEIIKDKLEMMERSIQSYRRTENILTSFLDFIDKIASNSKEEVSSGDRIDIELTLHSIFYFYTLTQNKKATLIDMFNNFFESTKSGQLKMYRHHPFDKIDEALMSSIGGIEIDEKRPFLYKMSNFFKLRDSPVDLLYFGGPRNFPSSVVHKKNNLFQTNKYLKSFA